MAQVHIALTRAQMSDIMYVYSSYRALILLEEFSRYRPKQSPLQDPRGWLVNEAVVLVGSVVVLVMVAVIVLVVARKADASFSISILSQYVNFITHTISVGTCFPFPSGGDMLTSVHV